MPIFINESILSLPEQVEKNKNDIKAIEETIGGIDPNLVAQVQTNTSDISAIKQEQIVQNTAINQNGGKITTLETKTANINANGTEYSNIEKVTNTSGVMEISADGLTLESTDVLDILTPNANINVNNSGVVKISNDNNSNKLEYDMANGSFKVSGDHTLEFDSVTGDLTIDGGAVGGSTYYMHIVKFTFNNFRTNIKLITQDPEAYTASNYIAKIYDSQYNESVEGTSPLVCYNYSTVVYKAISIYSNNTNLRIINDSGQVETIYPTFVSDAVIPMTVFRVN